MLLKINILICQCLKKVLAGDINLYVLKKKKDKLTLSHIGIAIRQCVTLSKEDEGLEYISDGQRKALIELLKSKDILPREIALLESM